MNFVALVRHAIVVLAAVFCLNFSGASHAQPAPTASHLAAAKELVDLVGAAREFEPLVTGVIIQSASNYLQGNPAMAKDLNEIAEQLVTEYLPRKAELPNEVVRLYASRLTEKEIRDVLTFYKSPLGQKMLTESQYVISEAFKKGEVFAANLRVEVAAKVRAELIKRGHKL
jgi:hypothetical protein